jgi:hypothetical protein
MLTTLRLRSHQYHSEEGTIEVMLEAVAFNLPCKPLPVRIWRIRPRRKSFHENPINRTKYYWFIEVRFFASLRMTKRALFVMNAAKMKFTHS